MIKIILEGGNMKRFIKKSIVAVAILATAVPTSTIWANNVDFTSSPEYTSQASTNSEGMTDDYDYTIRNTTYFDTDGSRVLVMVDGMFRDVDGILKDGTTYVQLGILDYFDVTSSYENGVLTIDGKVFDYGDKTPFVDNMLTYVPVRVIADSLGREVGFVSKDTEVTKLNNSIVWIETASEMDNAGYSVEEVKEWLKEQLYVNENLFIEYGNFDHFTKESVENMEYVGQLGRYAVFNSTRPILVDMENKRVYFYHFGHDYSNIAKMIDDGAYLIPQMESMIMKLPEEFEGKYVIGAVSSDEVSDKGGLYFNVYEKESSKYTSEDGFRYGTVFYVKQWDKEYSEKNPPFYAGGCFDLYRTMNHNYMLHTPSDVQGYEADETAINNYYELSRFVNDNHPEAMKNSFAPSDESILDNYIDDETKEAFYGEWEIKELAGLFTYMKDDSEYKNMDSIIGKTFMINDAVFKNEDLGEYQYGATETVDPLYFIDGRYDNPTDFYNAWKLDIEGLNEDDKITVINAPTMEFILVNDDRLFVIFPDESACFELTKIAE